MHLIFHDNSRRDYFYIYIKDTNISEGHSSARSVACARLPEYRTQSKHAIASSMQSKLAVHTKLLCMRRGMTATSLRLGTFILFLLSRNKVTTVEDSVGNRKLNALAAELDQGDDGDHLAVTPSDSGFAGTPLRPVPLTLSEA